MNKMLTLEEIYNEYKYGNYIDNSNGICHDVAIYISKKYDLGFSYALMVTDTIYEEKNMVENGENSD